MDELEGLQLEWKSEWNDKCLQSLCAFANTSGGQLIIGKNDHGQCVQVLGLEPMLEKIPHIISNQLGIVPRVKKHVEDENDLLLIEVQPCEQPISYKGRYYVRTGSITQALLGNALTEFLFKKMSQKPWDACFAQGLCVKDFDAKVVESFCKQAQAKKRLPEDVLSMPAEKILTEQLNLVQDQKVTNAAALCFYAQPDRFVYEAVVKIGYFKTESDVLYHDDVRGNLFQQVEDVMQLLTTKYLKAFISYNRLDRIETLPVPVLALREALVNAVIHKDYMSKGSIRIQVFDDKIMICNPCSFPYGMKVEDLIRTSRQLNPLIAQMFFLRGWVEKWGRGIAGMKQACAQAGVPEPIITARCADKEFCVEFANHETENHTLRGQNKSQHAAHVLSKTALEQGKHIEQIILQNAYKKL